MDGKAAVEIELVDGTILDAPDGSDASKVAKAYLAKQRRGATVAADPSEYDTSSPEYQAKYGATSGQSGFENFRAGAGKAFYDIGRGARQIGETAADFIAPRADGTSRESESRARVTEQRQLDAPLMQSTGGKVGYVTGTVASTLLPAGAAGNSIRGAALVGGALGASQPVGEGESRIKNAAIGAAVSGGSQALFKGIGALAKPVKPRLNPQQARAVGVLESAGVPLDLAQKTGNRTLTRLKAGLEGNPYTAGTQIAAVEKQAAAFNKAVLGTVGESAEAATPDVMSRAASRIGQVFDDVASRNPITIDNRAKVEVTNVLRNAANELDDTQLAPLRNLVDGLSKKVSGGQLSGEAYQVAKSSLDRVSAAGGQKGYWAAQLRNTLDDALERSANPADFKALKEARRQWFNLKRIEDTVARDAQGHISPSLLFNTFARKGLRGKSVYGRGDLELVKLARAGKMILADKLPNSGTAQRLAAQVAIPATVGVAAGALTGDPKAALKYAALAYAAPKAVQIALNNPSVANALMGGYTPKAVQNALLAPSSNQLINLIGRQTAYGLAAKP